MSNPHAIAAPVALVSLLILLNVLVLLSPDS